MRISTTARSGCCSPTSRISSDPSPAWPTTSYPPRSSKLAMPSRINTSSSATMTRVPRESTPVTARVSRSTIGGARPSLPGRTECATAGQKRDMSGRREAGPAVWSPGRCHRRGRQSECTPICWRALECCKGAGTTYSARARSAPSLPRRRRQGCHRPSWSRGGAPLLSRRAAPSRSCDPGCAGEVESGLPSPGAGEHLSAYLEAAIDCVIVADASGRIVEFNPAAERTFGYSRQEALGRTMAELIVPPSLRERHIAGFARFVKTREGSIFGRRVELTGMRADGSEFPVELALSQVEAEPVLICGALRDISAKKQAERHLRELVDEQAALRRVATLVAYEASSEHLVAVVAEQVARVFDVPLVRLIRFEPSGSVVIGGFSESDDEPFAIGSRWPVDTPGLLATIRHTGRAAHVDDYAKTPGDGAAVVRAAGMRSAVGSPIVVEGRGWGAIVLFSPRRASLPEGAGGRLAGFPGLLAAAPAEPPARRAPRPPRGAPA